MVEKWVPMKVGCWVVKWAGVKAAMMADERVGRRVD